MGGAVDRGLTGWPVVAGDVVVLVRDRDCAFPRGWHPRLCLRRQSAGVSDRKPEYCPLNPHPACAHGLFGFAFEALEPEVDGVIDLGERIVRLHRSRFDEAVKLVFDLSLDRFVCLGEDRQDGRR